MKERPSLKPRETGTKDPEDLHRILSKIFPDDVADELFINLTAKEEKGDGDGLH